ncbi:MAG: histidine kinase [Verrucomicrobia bacterium]|nr:histidine kinase [Verrucomicrobiota bacterium]
MGPLLRLVVFILVLSGLAVGTGVLLLQERQREAALEKRFAEAAEPLSRDETRRLLREHHTRSQQTLLLGGGLALLGLVLIALVPARAGVSLTPEKADPQQARTEIQGWETLARANLAQRAELDTEREARHRTEQDLHLQQVLANHALQTQITLGRDLHDGLVQTLYATGLVLETASARLASPTPDAPEAAALIQRAKTNINAAIRETRGAIGGLTRDALEAQSLPEAITALLDHLDGGRLQERRVLIEPGLPSYANATRTELLQIIREASSNALRHGAATQLEIEMTSTPDGASRLTIRDNGAGFDPQSIKRGHGLDNLSARARVLGAQLEIYSAAGRGAVIALTLPAETR